MSNVERAKNAIGHAKLTGKYPSIPQMFAQTAGKYPTRACFTAHDGAHKFQLDYRTALDYVSRLAGEIQRSGAPRGSAMVLVGVNSPQWALAYLAILSAGMVVVPLDPLSPPERVAALASRVNALRIFCDDSEAQRFAGLSAAHISLSPDKNNYLLANIENEAPMASNDPVNACDPAAILFTSGTTGLEKGVPLTHENLTSDTYLTQELVTIYHTDIFYALLPLYHVYCMTAIFLVALSAGAEVVFAKTPAIASMMRDLASSNITILMGVPLLFNKLMIGIQTQVAKKGKLVAALFSALSYASRVIKRACGINIGKFLFADMLKKASLNHLRLCISGGAPLSAGTFRFFNQLGINFVQGYGLTETSPIITLNPVRRYKETSTGIAIPGADIKLINVNAEGIGEVTVKGPMVFAGYYNDAEATRLAFTDDGYFKTGDLGSIDIDGYMHLAGRSKNIIVTESGKNVYPEEIETLFQFRDEFSQVLVRGYEADTVLKIEKIEAILVYSDAFMQKYNTLERKGETLRIIKEINALLPMYTTIARARVLDEPMEMSGSGKIKRHMVAGDAGEIVS